MYPSAADISTIIDRVEDEFSGVQDFSAMALGELTWLNYINESLDRIYQTSFPQRDEFTIDTVVGQAEYNIDGGANNFPKEIGYIVKVYYDGSPLKYRFLYRSEVIPAGTATDNGTPNGWYERWDNGIRKVGLAYEGAGQPPDEIVELTVVATRFPENMDATNDDLPIPLNFWSLVTDMLIQKMCERLSLRFAGDNPAKSAAWDRKAGKYEVKVERGLRRMKRLAEGQMGTKVTVRTYVGPQDIFNQ